MFIGDTAPALPAVGRRDSGLKSLVQDVCRGVLECLAGPSARDDLNLQALQLIHKCRAFIFVSLCLIEMLSLFWPGKRYTLYFIFLPWLALASGQA